MDKFTPVEDFMNLAIQDHLASLLRNGLLAVEDIPAYLRSSKFRQVQAVLAKTAAEGCMDELNKQKLLDARGTQVAALAVNVAYAAQDAMYKAIDNGMDSRLYVEVMQESAQYLYNAITRACKEELIELDRREKKGDKNVN